MSDELLNKAVQVIDDEIYDEDVIQYIEKRWPQELLMDWEYSFLLQVLKGVKPSTAYSKARGTTKTEDSAKNGAYRTLKKLNIPFSEVLEFCGHGQETVMGALDSMLKINVDSYLKHITKLKNLDVQRVEHSGSITLPVINIYSSVEEKNE